MWNASKKNPFTRSGLSKYKASRQSLDGHSFASKGEAAMYQQLKLEERAGLIKDIQVQDHVNLTGPPSNIIYIADFKIFDLVTGTHVWVEFKGMETDVWRIKRRLWMHWGPGILRVYKARGARLVLTETLHPAAPRPTHGG